MEEGVLEMQVRVELVQIKLDEATEKAASYRGPRKNLKEAKALFAQIEDFKKELREEKIKYNNLVDVVFEKVLTKKTTTPEQEAIIRIFNPKGLFTKYRN
jgi:hypothetical protein